MFAQFVFYVFLYIRLQYGIHIFNSLLAQRCGNCLVDQNCLSNRTTHWSKFLKASKTGKYDFG